MSNTEVIKDGIEVYTFNRDLYPAVVQIFENLRLDLTDIEDMDDDEELDEPLPPDELNIEEAGQYFKEACRILKIDPMALACLEAYTDDWSLDPGWCVNIYTVSSYAEGYIRDMFANSVLKDTVEITVTRHEDDDGIGPYVSISVGFTYDYSDLSLSRQYAELLKDVLENRSGI